MYPIKIILIGCGDPHTGRDMPLRTEIRRELTNLLACVRGEYPDVISAIRQIELAADENVLFLIQLKVPEDVEQVRRLSTTYPRQPILGLRDSTTDRKLFLDALKAGAAFVIPLPLDPEEFKSGLEWISRQFGFEPKKSTVIAVAGVNSAVGATTLALNLAWETAVTLQRQCILVELALRLGVLASYLNVEPRYSLDQLIGEMENLDVEVVGQVLTKVVDNLDLLSGPPKVIQARNLTTAELLRIIQFTRPLADVIFVDVPCTYDDLYFEVLTHADKIVLVMEQKLPSARAVQMVTDTLKHIGIDRGRPLIVVNRYNAKTPGFTAEDLRDHIGVEKLHTVANDASAVNEAIEKGQSLRQAAPSSPALADICSLARSLLGVAESPVESPSFFKRVVRTLGLRSRE